MKSPLERVSPSPIGPIERRELLSMVARSPVSKSRSDEAGLVAVGTTSGFWESGACLLKASQSQIRLMPVFMGVSGFGIFTLNRWDH